MHMLYNSESYAVVQIQMADPHSLPTMDGDALMRDGFEIVDKFAKKELFIDGPMAVSFKVDVEALIDTSPSVEEFDAFLDRFAGMAMQPVVMH